MAYKSSIGIPYHVKSIIEKHLNDGCIVECTYDDEVDYKGTDLNEIIDAMKACEMEAVHFIKDGKYIDWFLYCDMHTSEECIIDCGVDGYADQVSSSYHSQMYLVS